jgi:hypothetical protein
MKRRIFLTASLGLGLCLVAVALAQNPNTSIPTQMTDTHGNPVQGKSVALKLGNFKTATVSAATNEDGHTVVNTGNIPPKGVSVDFFRCPDGTIIGVEHDGDRPCPGATFIGVAPIVPGITTSLDFRDGLIDNNGNFVTSITVTTPTGSFTFNGFFSRDSGGSTNDGLSAKPDENSQAFTVTGNGPNGESVTITGVLPADVGLPLDQLEKFYVGSTTIVPLAEPDPGTFFDQPPQNMQDSGSGTPSSPEQPKPPQTTPGTTPGNTSGWAHPGANWLPALAYLQPAALLIPVSATASLRWSTMFDPVIPQAKPQAQAISYTIIANGNSTGEAFTLIVNDPSGRIKTIPIPSGTSLEPTGRKLSKPLPADAPGTKQPVNGYCLQFHKEPPASGMLYRIAGPDKQRANEPVRYILAAVDYLKARNQLHPDIELPEYLDAARQYAIWSKQESWDQKLFTENWIERTRKNAQNLKVKWSKDMEKTLREAAPGRWRDISQSLEVAANAERARTNARPAAAPARPGKF